MKLKLMNSFAKTALVVASCLCMASVAQAGFVNGGFETGDFSGWTLKYGSNTGYGSGAAGLANPLNYVSWGGSGVTPVVVDKASSTDSYVPGFASTFVGNKMAKINDIGGGYNVTQLSQTATITAADLTGGLTNLYINWISVMENPAHPAGENPWFNINVTAGLSTYSVTHFSTDSGWAETGGAYSSIFEGSGQDVITGLYAGEVITVTMTVADCAQGGHGAYAYLDGIGTSQVKPPTSVPEASSTLALFGLGLVGLAALRRRLA